MAADDGVSPVGSRRAQLTLRAVTERIIGVFFDVYNELGTGFLESVYAEAMRLALETAGLNARREVGLAVSFRGRVVGNFRADLVIEDCVLVELKAARQIDAAHLKQMLNYLRATELEVGMLLNFGPRPSFRRLIFSNSRKNPR